MLNAFSTLNLFFSLLFMLVSVCATDLTSTFTICNGHAPISTYSFDCFTFPGSVETPEYTRAKISYTLANNGAGSSSTDTCDFSISINLDLDSATIYSQNLYTNAVYNLKGSVDVSSYTSGEVLTVTTTCPNPVLNDLYYTILIQDLTSSPLSNPNIYSSVQVMNDISSPVLVKYAFDDMFPVNIVNTSPVDIKLADIASVLTHSIPTQEIGTPTVNVANTGTPIAIKIVDIGNAVTNPLPSQEVGTPSVSVVNTVGVNLVSKGAGFPTINVNVTQPVSIAGLVQTQPIGITQVNLTESITLNTTANVLNTINAIVSNTLLQALPVNVYVGASKISVGNPFPTKIHGIAGDLNTEVSVPLNTFSSIQGLSYNNDTNVSSLNVNIVPLPSPTNITFTPFNATLPFSLSDPTYTRHCEPYHDLTTKMYNVDNYFCQIAYETTYFYNTHILLTFMTMPDMVMYKSAPATLVVSGQFIINGDMWQTLNNHWIDYYAATGYCEWSLFRRSINTTNEREKLFSYIVPVSQVSKTHYIDFQRSLKLDILSEILVWGQLYCSSVPQVIPTTLPYTMSYHWTTNPVVVTEITSDVNVIGDLAIHNSGSSSLYVETREGSLLETHNNGNVPIVNAYGEPFVTNSHVLGTVSVVNPNGSVIEVRMSSDVLVRNSPGYNLLVDIPGDVKVINAQTAELGGINIPLNILTSTDDPIYGILNYIFDWIKSAANSVYYSTPAQFGKPTMWFYHYNHTFQTE
jgi:hypothetical protein